MHQFGAYAAPAEFGRDSKVQQFPLAGAGDARDRKACDSIFANRDLEMEAQVILRLPLRGLGTGGLDRRDLREIVRVAEAS